MAFIVEDPDSRANQGDLVNASYDYEYPSGLDLKPGSKLHTKIVTNITRRARESWRVMSLRHHSWNEIDRTLTAYVPLKEAERLVKEKDHRKPVSIVVPYSYATLETLLTYFTSALLNDPIFSYKGVSPEDSVGALMLSKVINQQALRSRLALQLHTMCRDSLAYGIGPAACVWERKLGKRTVRAEEGFYDFLSQWIGKGPKKQQVETVVYEGNALKNIDPYSFLPDPSVSIHQLQNGEFVGWIERSNYLDCLSLETTDEDVFNVKYLKHIDGKTSIYSNDQSKRKERYGGDANLPQDTLRPVDKIHMYVKVIPKEWGLSSLEYPEKWYFVIGGDSVVLEARPMALDHDSFPITAGAPDYDGYSITPVSRIEMVYGLQGTLDWLFSSHIANVRKAINDTLIVDPYLVNIDDLKDPEPGKLVRMRRAAWGKGVDNAVKQLAVTDVTRGHIADASYVVDLINRTSAVSDGVMGVRRNGGERVSAAEAQGDRMSALSRLERLARVMSLQAFHDIGHIFASHVQQFMSEETYVNFAGDWPKELADVYQVEQGKAKVTPFDLLINYDVEVKDGSVPGGAFADIWVQLFQIMTQQPEIAQQFDVVRVFKHIAQGLGAKDINSFVRKGGSVNAQTMPDEAVMQQVQAGNMVSVGEM